jgi:FlaA1/EpsC-like NDP-sugar epimerase
MSLGRKEAFYRGKTVLVTGGAGSIGSALVSRLVTLRPRAVRVLDINETGLFDLEQRLGSSTLRILVGDVKDPVRLHRAFENVDVVFHAAALKHVPLCEFNPFDAVQTNVAGTENVIRAALDRNVRRMILVSTDKAVNPSNVMGATKLLAERITISANSYRGPRYNFARFSCVRFGNVLDSRGSVIPLFRSQIEAGGPVTLTDRSMTRFVMNPSAAVELILRAGADAKAGEIYIPRMRALRIEDLADVMIARLARRARRRRVRIEVVGRRPGEKLYEELMTRDEARRCVRRGDVFVLAPEGVDRKVAVPESEFLSDHAPLLGRARIDELLKREGLTGRG